MDQGNVIEFLVDEQYENEKGIFTVLSIHRNEMVIRWESGEEIKTDIELQRNIQARRQWEVLEKEKAALSAKSSRKSGAAKAAAVFQGFKDTDFKNSASGTKWRGRNQLGGAVTHKLPDNNYHFNSWAFANKPEMHWLDTTHHKSQSGENCAKFFARLDHDFLFYGFSLDKSKNDNEASQNWNSFMHWLAEDENEERLHAVALKNGMAIYDKNHPKSPVFVPIEGGWRKGNVENEETVDKLHDAIGLLVKDGLVSLEVVKSLEKEASLSNGKDIAVDIAELFSNLIPLYRAAWAPIR
jgi:hypothetical protein